MQINWRVVWPLDARKSWEEVSVFVSLCLPSTSSKTVRKEMATWWKEDGQYELLPSPGTTPDDEWGGLEDEEGSDEEEPEESMTKTTVTKNNEHIVSSIESVENQVVLEQQFENLDEQASAGKADAEMEIDAEHEKIDTDEEHTAVPTEKRVKSTPQCDPADPAEPRTLSQVLSMAGCTSFAAMVDDTDAVVSHRVQSLFEAMGKFGRHMRSKEGILSPASIYGKLPVKQHNRLEHSLAVARAAHQCSAGRQSRHSLWANYSERILKALGKDAAASKLNSIGPPSLVNGVTQYQLVVVKPCQANTTWSPLRFGIPLTVWRVARRTVKTGRKLLPAGKMPMEYLAHLHVLLLAPGESKQSGITVLEGTRLGRSWVIYVCLFRPNFS